MNQRNTPNFDNSYHRLPSTFYSPQLPSKVPTPGLLKVNKQLAEQLGFSASHLESEEGLTTLAGNALFEGSEPIATVYAGHQFGGWNPQLGDGRAVLLGEVLDTQGTRYDIQLKGAGRTPYSRGGDGKSPIGPVIREYVLSEAMNRLGVPSTRALAAVSTGELVFREQAVPGAILCRVAKSHIRVGTVQFFASRKDTEALKQLADHVIARHYPEAQHSATPYLAMLEGIIAKQASLIAHWQQLGFIHGVMNTDNMLLCGETVDYGPCAFMDNFHRGRVFSSIDQNGRYAYGNQPAIGHWNLAMLAQALLPILAEEEDAAVALAQAAVDKFPAQFTESYTIGMLRKLGIVNRAAEDESLVADYLELLETEGADFTLSFRRLAELSHSEYEGDSIQPLFDFPESFDEWLNRWQERCAKEALSSAQQQEMMLATNPVFIPRNHLVQAAITAAQENNDLSVFERLTEVMDAPYTYAAELEEYATPPRPEQVVHKTFCGT